MKVTPTSGLLALGLAGRAAADDWSAVVPPSSTTVAAAQLTGAWAAPISTVTATVTATTTVYHDTTTVYRSTVFVGPGFCATTTVTVGAGATNVAPVAAGSTWAAVNPVAPGSTWTAVNPVAPASSWAAVNPVAPASSWAAVTTVAPAPAKGSSWGAATAVDPAKPAGSNWIDWANDASTIATGYDIFTWTGDAPTNVHTAAAPTYTGWPSDGSWPEPGSAASNCTAPQKGSSSGSCNSAGDRSKWCGGQSISSDYYAGTYSSGNTCSYDLTITEASIDFDGTGAKAALAVNGQVPGPLIECNWGDTLQVTVHNKMSNQATTIHWHGITQKGTNDQDGVPGITECGIAPGSSRTYTMKLSSYGTGWYHSHVMTQFGDGVRGPMIVHGPATANYDIDMGTVMIDDTFNGTIEQMNQIISHTGPTGSINYLLNGHNTSPDLSSGKHSLWSVQAGKKHLFRFINSASQNMYSVHFDNHVMQVIATDYVPIVPYTTEWLNIGIGQRYDVIVEMDQPVAGYFLRAVTQTGCPSGSVNTGLGNANGIILYDGAPATLPTSTFGNKSPSDFAICADEPIGSLKPFLVKSAGSLDAFSASASVLPGGQVAQVATSDDGNVFRWFLNNGAINVNYTQPTLQTLGQTGGANSSLISNAVTLSTANTWVYFIIQNQFFASHPMHLHGHDFSLLGQGTTAWNPSLVSTLNFANPPRRDTAMLVGSNGPGSPPGYTVIGFETDNPGAWLMHCHIIWHVDGGLALQFNERPKEISAYSSSSAFQSECSSMESYYAANPGSIHKSSSSGLKRRTYFDDFLERRSENVVRRAGSPEKQFLESNLKRGLGDGYKPRHMRH